APAALERPRRRRARGRATAVLRRDDARQGPAGAEPRAPTPVARTSAQARCLAVSRRHRARAHQASAERAAARPAGRPAAQVALIRWVWAAIDGGVPGWRLGGGWGGGARAAAGGGGGGAAATGRSDGAAATGRGCSRASPNIKAAGSEYQYESRRSCS